MFLWRTDALPVEIDDGINLPEYTLDNITSLVCAANNGNGLFCQLSISLFLPACLSFSVFSRSVSLSLTHDAVHFAMYFIWKQIYQR